MANVGFQFVHDIFEFAKMMSEDLDAHSKIVLYVLMGHLLELLPEQIWGKVG